MESDKNTEASYIQFKRDIYVSNVELLSIDYLITLLENGYSCCAAFLQMGLKYCRSQHRLPVYPPTCLLLNISFLL